MYFTHDGNKYYFNSNIDLQYKRKDFAFVFGGISDIELVGEGLQYFNFLVQKNNGVGTAVISLYTDEDIYLFDVPINLGTYEYSDDRAKVAVAEKTDFEEQATVTSERDLINAFEGVAFNTSSYCACTINTESISYAQNSVWVSDPYHSEAILNHNTDGQIMTNKGLLFGGYTPNKSTAINIGNFIGLFPIYSNIEQTPQDGITIPSVMENYKKVEGFYEVAGETLLTNINKYAEMRFLLKNCNVSLQILDSKEVGGVTNPRAAEFVFKVQHSNSFYGNEVTTIAYTRVDNGVPKYTILPQAVYQRAGVGTAVLAKITNLSSTVKNDINAGFIIISIPVIDIEYSFYKPVFDFKKVGGAIYPNIAIDGVFPLFMLNTEAVEKEFTKSDFDGVVSNLQYSLVVETDGSTSISKNTDFFSEEKSKIVFSNIKNDSATAKINNQYSFSSIDINIGIETRNDTSILEGKPLSADSSLPMPFESKTIPFKKGGNNKKEIKIPLFDCNKNEGAFLRITDTNYVTQLINERLIWTDFDTSKKGSKFTNVEITFTCFVEQYEIGYMMKGFHKNREINKVFTCDFGGGYKVDIYISALKIKYGNNLCELDVTGWVVNPSDNKDIFDRIKKINTNI